VKTQIVYETNVDYEATYQNLVECNVVIVDKTEKGLIWFKLKGSKTIFTLSPYGKLQVKWSRVEDKKALLPIVKNLFVPEEGERLRMRPTGQQAFIPYPVPQRFKLYWCDEVTEYVRKLVRAPAKEPVIVTFIMVAIVSVFGFLALHGLSKTALPIASNQTGLEGLAMRIVVQISPYLVLVPIVVFALIAVLTRVRPSILDKLKL
jgi:hypothetical protein